MFGEEVRRRPFLRAVEVARGGYNAVITDNRRQLQTFGTGGRAEQARLKLICSAASHLARYDKTVLTTQRCLA